MLLGRKLLHDNYLPPAGLKVGPLNDYPEKAIQFGEGNFMRAFVDWMINEMNGRGLFNGRVVLVQPIKEGLCPRINEQNGLYTLYLRGVQKGVLKEEKSIVTAVSRCIDPYREWAGLLACAENPSLRFLFSNTTEAGIAYKPEPLTGETPVSFPAKAAAFLYHRFKAFGGAPESGLIIIPCELIDRNGDELKKTVLQHCADWKLPGQFTAWLEKSNYFFNSLVDRIVTGFPRDDAGALFAELGYEDQLLDTGEIFHLWVIECPPGFDLEAELPFRRAGLNVPAVPDMAPYRTRKVRILNGSHTLIVPVAFLSGLDTVKEAVDDALIGLFLRRSLEEEIIPTLDLPRGEVQVFAVDVLERFQNPHIQHYLIDIALNSTSKFKTRVLPSLLGCIALEGRLPKLICFSLAALCVFFRISGAGSTGAEARRDQGPYAVRDSEAALDFFREAWADCDGSLPGCLQLAEKVLSSRGLWEADLRQVEGLCALVGSYLHSILSSGMRSALEVCLNGGGGE
ncbi:MAG: tagaturonate reductase [Bacillota bacterium]